eukprot:6945751-Prorocentrum_lima.AAC.1
MGAALSQLWLEQAAGWPSPRQLVALTAAPEASVKGRPPCWKARPCEEHSAEASPVPLRIPCKPLALPNC